MFRDLVDAIGAPSVMGPGHYNVLGGKGESAATIIIPRGKHATKKDVAGGEGGVRVKEECQGPPSHSGSCERDALAGQGSPGADLRHPVQAG